MFLTQLPQIADRKKKRLGRGAGSGKGAKSTRGTTRHQAAREDIPLSFEGGQNRMIKKFPLLRGKNRNKPLRPMPYIIGIDVLNTFEDGATVDVKTLVAKKLIDTPNVKVSVKVIGKGTLNKKLTVVLPVSQSVKIAIEKAGGSVQSL